MHDINCFRGNSTQNANKNVLEAGQCQGHSKNRDSFGLGRAPGQSPYSSTSQAGMRLHMPLHAPVRPRLKRGSREHESGECPKNQEHRRYMAHAKNFAAWCLGTGEMNNTTAEAFGCENLTRGRVLLDCGATDTVGSVEAIESILKLTGCLWMPTIDPCANSVTPTVNKR